MKLFGNRRRAAHAAPRQKLPRGTRAAIIAVCVVLALTGGVFAAWKLLVKPVQRPSLSQPHRDRRKRAGAGIRAGRGQTLRHPCHTA